MQKTKYYLEITIDKLDVPFFMKSKFFDTIQEVFEWLEQEFIDYDENLVRLYLMQPHFVGDELVETSECGIIIGNAVYHWEEKIYEYKK